jgi:hypothetical protein
LTAGSLSPISLALSPRDVAEAELAAVVEAPALDDAVVE